MEKHKKPFTALTIAFINIAASYADALGIQYVVVGFNREEAATFPDNSAAYLAKANAALAYSTAVKTKLYCFTLPNNKTEIVRLAKKLKLDLRLTFSCYEKGPAECGRCESCLRKRRAMADA